MNVSNILNPDYENTMKYSLFSTELIHSSVLQTFAQSINSKISFIPRSQSEQGHFL